MYQIEKFFLLLIIIYSLQSFSFLFKAIFNKVIFYKFSKDNNLSIDICCLRLFFFI